jgi:hypothetical protein
MNNDFEILKKVAQARKTEKVIAGIEAGVFHPPESCSHWDSVVAQSVAAAGMAPFHYDRGWDSIPEPWRVHLLDLESCRRLARSLGSWMQLKPSNKLPGMLAACGCTLLVTWLPQFRGNHSGIDQIPNEKRAEIDDEHLAATAAMVQSLLLILTSAGLGTYWSSGGALGEQETFKRLGIGEHEKLMAAVFIEYPGGVGQVVERVPGKNRPLRSAPARWFSKVEIEF